MFSTTWSKPSSTVLFAAAITGLLCLWPAEAKSAGGKPTPTLCTVTMTPWVNADGSPEGIAFSGDAFQYKKGRYAESLGDPPVPPMLTLHGDIARTIAIACDPQADLPAAGVPFTFTPPAGTLVLQHYWSDPAYNWYTLLFFSWKIGKTSYSLWIHGAPPANPADGSPASLNSCAIDFTHDVDHPDNPHAGAHYRLEQMIGGKTTPYYGVTSFTVIVQPQ